MDDNLDFATSESADTQPNPKPWWFHGLISFWVAFIVAAFLFSGTRTVVLVVVGMIAISVTAATYGTTIGGNPNNPGGFDARAFGGLGLGAILVGLVSERFITEAELSANLMAAPIVIMFIVAFIFSKRHYNKSQ